MCDNMSDAHEDLDVLCVMLSVVNRFLDNSQCVPVYCHATTHGTVWVI